MPVFRFSLQRVLELRHRAELESAKGLADARMEADAARSVKADLDAARAAGVARLAEVHGSGGSVGHIRNLAYIVSKVEEQAGLAEAECEAADRSVSSHLKAFSEAFRDRKAIDHLKEKKLEQWRRDEIRSEMKELDEVALARYVRRDTDTLRGGAA